MWTWRTLAPGTMVLVRAAWFRCKRQAALFWAAFESLPYQRFAGAVARRAPASMLQGDRAGPHRIRLHLSFRPWLARYYDAAERSGPGQSQLDKNRLPRHA